MNKQAFPLDWPVGWKRTPDWQKAHARFGNSVASTPTESAVKPGVDNGLPVAIFSMEMSGAR